jgi:hypothetical protein
MKKLAYKPYKGIYASFLGGKNYPNQSYEYSFVLLYFPLFENNLM